MSVPIEDEEEEVFELPGSTAPVSNGVPMSSSTAPFSNGFPTSTFSAPVPPPAPTLTPAQLPNKTQAPKIDAPLFGSNKPLPKTDVPSFFAAPKPAEPKPDVPLFFAVPKPVEPKVDAPKPVESKAEVPSFFSVPKPVEKPVEVKSVPAPAPAPVPAPETKPTESELKSSASAVPVSALPVFSFTAPTATSTPKTKTAEARTAADLPISKLPVFTFGSLAPAPVAKNASFNWAAAGSKAPVAAASGSGWTCDTCMLSNPASAVDKCTVCDAKRPGAAAPATAPAPALAPAPAPAKTASFDWGAAGMKAPTVPTGGSWTCSTCSLSNPASATDKCTVCETAKPGAAPPTKTTSFNWGAAGIKAPSGPTDGQWTCATCSLSNPASATDKCTVCDAKRPGAAPVAKTASFDWGAAGLKMPVVAAGWTCGTCGLNNSESANKCTVCDAAR